MKKFLILSTIALMSLCAFAQTMPVPGQSGRAMRGPSVPPSNGQTVVWDGVQWVPADASGTASANGSTLATNTAAGATSITIGTIPSGLGVGRGYAVIEPYSTNCEIRRISSISGSTVTLVTGLSLVQSSTFVAASKKITATAETVSRLFPGARFTTSSSSNPGPFTVAAYPSDGSYDGTYITVNETVVNEGPVSTTFTMNLNNAHASGAAVLFQEGPVPVTYYGCKPSGSTSDAANNRVGIQRCIDDGYWTGFNDVYFPGFLGGRYYIDGPIYLEKLIRLSSPHQKAGVIAAAPTFASWNDDVALLITRRNGLTCRLANGGNDRYYIKGLGLDGQSVAYAKSTGFDQSDWPGTALVGTNTVSVHATLIKRDNQHGYIVYRALAAGTGGNSIRVAHLGGVSQTLAISVSGNDITVQLGTDGAGVVTSTTSAVIAAVNASGASALVNASLAFAGTLQANSAGTGTTAYNDGTGLPTVFALTALTAGTAPFVSGDVGRSIYLGTRYGARVITAYVSSSQVTVSGSAFTTQLAGVRFAVSPVNGLLGSHNQTSIMEDLRIEGCAGYGFGATGCQEFTARNLLTLGNGIHLRLVGVQFGHFIDVNMEHSLDAYVSFEGDAVNNVNRSCYFLGGHIEDVAPCDYFRVSGNYTFDGLHVDCYQATTSAGSKVIRVESTIANTEPNYVFTSWQWSGPNSGPYMEDNQKQSKTSPMTLFTSDNSNFIVPLLVNGSGVTFNQIRLGASTDAPKIIPGTGSPEGATTAPIGSIYLRKDGSANTAVYRKESGTGNTGWVAVSSAGAGVSTSPATAAANTIQPTADVVPLTVTARAAGQTANLEEWRDTAGALMSYVKSNGDELIKRRLFFQSESPKYSIEHDTSKFEFVGNGTTQLSIDNNGLFAIRPGDQAGRFILGVAAAVNSSKMTIAASSSNPVLVLQAITGLSGDTLDVVDNGAGILSRFNKAGYFMSRKVAAPADGDLANSEFALWLDDTAGAAKLMIKAKDSGGTVRTGTVLLP